MARTDNGARTEPKPTVLRTPRKRDPWTARLGNGQTLTLSCREPRARRAFVKLQRIYGKANVQLVTPSGHGED